MDSDGVNQETNRHTFDEQSAVVNEIRCAAFPLDYLLHSSRYRTMQDTNAVADEAKAELRIGKICV